MVGGHEDDETWHRTVVLPIAVYLTGRSNWLVEDLDEEQEMNGLTLFGLVAVRLVPSLESCWEQQATRRPRAKSAFVFGFRWLWS
jgi:hypothetical protein